LVLNDLYDKTIHYLSHSLEGLTYNRCQAIEYLKPEKKVKYQQEDRIYTQLASMRKNLIG